MEHIHHYTSLLLQWPPPDWATLHFQLCVLMIVSGLGAFIALLCLTAPYGRYSRPGWGPMINARLAWLVRAGTGSKHSHLAPRKPASCQRRAVR